MYFLTKITPYLILELVEAKMYNATNGWLHSCPLLPSLRPSNQLVWMCRKVFIPRYLMAGIVPCHSCFCLFNDYNFFYWWRLQLNNLLWYRNTFNFGTLWPPSFSCHLKIHIFAALTCVQSALLVANDRQWGQLLVA